MYPFDLRTFTSDLRRALAAGIGPAALPRPLRPLAVLLYSAFFLWLQVVHRVAFVLDDVLFRGWRGQTVTAPVFIVGVPRSGTTWVHRLLARDADTFTALTLGEILFAPAICEKRFFLGLRALDRSLGAPVARLSQGLQARLAAPLDGVHEVSLFAPEEDEMLLVHIWASHVQGLFVPHHAGQEPLAYFDRQASPAQRATVMGFYRDMVKRHLYARGGDRRFLAKNPCFAARVQSLQETFPDASLLVLVRTPDEVVPSVLSLTDRVGKGLANADLQGPAHVARTVDLLEHFYHHPSDVAPALFGERFRLVRYPALLLDLETEIAAVYRAIGGTPGPALRSDLPREAERARSHKSQHRYSAATLGLDRAWLRRRLVRVYERFGFPTSDPT